MPDMFSGDCLTPYSTAAKTVDIDNYTLTTGVLLAVKFLAGKEGTVPAHPTLNVSSTGAIPIVLETDEIEFIPGGNMLYLFTYDGEGYNIIGYNSEDNPDGVSKWYAGTHITGTSTTETVFPQSEVDNAVVGDMYLNTSTNNVYQCTFAGVPAIAKWKYIANIEGAPGFSPRATVTKSGSTATITITDEEGTTSETVSDGEDGQDGQDGYSPSATVTKTGDTATITITDKDGTTTETVSDGTDGTDGQDGYSPTATVSKTGDTATITITDKDGTTTETISDGQDGAPGQPGEPGEDGHMLYGTSSTGASTGTKVVVCTDAEELYAGLTVFVAFSAANTAASLKLNVNSLGAKSVYFAGAVASSTNLFLWGAKSCIQFTYDGTYWVPVGYPCVYYGACSTAAGTAAKTTTINQIVICKGTTLNLKMTNANESSGSTLNVTSTGAKSIYANGETLDTNSKFNWIDNATVSFTFDGQYWLIGDTTSSYLANAAQNTANTATENITDLNLYLNGGYATELTSRFSEEQLICDSGVFYEEVGGTFGTYTFTYDGSNWKLDGTTVDISDYGLHLETTPSASDTIIVDLTEVVGSMTDINNQYNTLNEKVDSNADAADSDLTAAQEQLLALIDAQADALINTQTQLGLITNKTTGMGFTNQYGFVLYGQNATDNTGFKLQLGAQAINFIYGALGSSSSVMASVSGNALNISNANISKQLRFGNFAFIPRSNGNMSLKYLG